MEHRDVWEFVGGQKRVVLYGSYCEQLQTGAHEVTAVYECPVITWTIN